MKKDVLLLFMDEEALSEPELMRVKKELEEATGATVVAVHKKLGRSLDIQYLIPPIHPRLVLLKAQEPGGD